MRLSRLRGQMGEKHLGPKQKPSTTHIMNRYKFGFRNRSAADQLHFCERLLVPIAALPPEGVLASRRLMRGSADEIVARIDAEAAEFRTRLASPEAKAAFAAFLNRKK